MTKRNGYFKAFQEQSADALAMALEVFFSKEGYFILSIDYIPPSEIEKKWTAFVKNVKIKANTKDHFAGLNTVNNKRHPCKPILDVDTSDVCVSFPRT